VGRRRDCRQSPPTPPLELSAAAWAFLSWIVQGGRYRSFSAVNRSWRRIVFEPFDHGAACSTRAGPSKGCRGLARDAISGRDSRNSHVSRRPCRCFSSRANPT
jgi:hypothetical protein